MLQSASADQQGGHDHFVEEIQKSNALHRFGAGQGNDLDAGGGSRRTAEE